MKKTIWIINQYACHLEERHLNLARNFAEKGYSTVVITSSFHHGLHTYMFDETYKVVEKYTDVHYIYLRSQPAYQNNGGKRILNMIDFCRIYLTKQNRIAEDLGEPGYVIASSAPPFMWEIGYKTAKRYGAKFIAEFRDIWPLSLIEVQGVSAMHPLVKLFDRIERRAYRRADAIVGTMPNAYIHVCNDLGFPRNKVHWIPNGIDIEKAEKGGEPLPEELDNYLSNHWCCIYIGSIVKSESVDYIIESWKKVSNYNIYFAIIGDGNQSTLIDNMISKIEGDRIRHFGSIKKEQIPQALYKAKCCLAAIPNYPIYRFGLSMNKLSDYLFSGKPVVFACDVDNVVIEAGGYVVPFGDKQAMAEAIEHCFVISDSELEEIKEHEIRIIKEKYDYRVISNNYLKLLLSL